MCPFWWSHCSISLLSALYIIFISQHTNFKTKSVACCYWLTPAPATCHPFGSQRHWNHTMFFQWLYKKETLMLLSEPTALESLIFHPLTAPLQQVRSEKQSELRPSVTFLTQQSKKRYRKTNSYICCKLSPEATFCPEAGNRKTLIYSLPTARFILWFAAHIKRCRFWKEKEITGFLCAFFLLLFIFVFWFFLPILISRGKVLRCSSLTDIKQQELQTRQEGWKQKLILLSCVFFSQVHI